MWHKPCRTFHPWCLCIKTRCLFMVSRHLSCVHMRLVPGTGRETDTCWPNQWRNCRLQNIIVRGEFGGIIASFYVTTTSQRHFNVIATLSLRHVSVEGQRKVIRHHPNLTTKALSMLGKIKFHLHRWYRLFFNLVLNARHGPSGNLTKNNFLNFNTDYTI